MPVFLTSLLAWAGARAAIIGACLLAAASLLGGGYVWGSTHATGLAMEASARAAQAQAAAISASYDATVTGYAARLKAQAARGDQLAGELTEARAALSASTAAAKERISHAVLPQPGCDLPADAVGILREQPARH